MKKKTVRVWGIFYRVRANRYAQYAEWVGPIGPYALLDIVMPANIVDMCGGRAFFFRTRQQARDVVKKKNIDKNRTWTWVQYTVRPVKLTYEGIKKIKKS